MIIQQLDEVSKEVLSSYNIIEKTKSTFILKSSDRQQTLDNIKNQLLPNSHWKYEPFGGSSSLGRMVFANENNKKLIYLLFKPLQKSEGELAATNGYQLEQDISSKLKELLNDCDVEVSTASSGSGSDLLLKYKEKSNISIEIKTTLATDFGQFRIGFDIKENKWLPIETKNFKKNSTFFQLIFNETIKDFINEKGLFPENINKDILAISNDKIWGLKPSFETGETKKILQNEWFDNRNDKIIDFNFDVLNKYYSEKGDSFIQLGKHGLYALTKELSDTYNIPCFFKQPLIGSVRFRIKPDSGHNGTHSFSIAIRIKGSLDKSNIVLPENCDIFIKLLKENWIS